MNTRMLGLSLALSVVASGVLGCASTTPTTADRRENLNERTDVTLASMKRMDVNLQNAIDSAYGYALFPEAGKAGVLVAGASFGRGEVYEQGKFIGYAKMEQGTVGPQVGGQSYDMLILFENAAALRKFTDNQWTPAANASAVILKSGVGATYTFKDGVAVVIDPKGGAMAEASVGGQKFTFESGSRESN